jgi:hypothetical protein
MSNILANSKVLSGLRASDLAKTQHLSNATVDTVSNLAQDYPPLARCTNSLRSYRSQAIPG